MLPFQCFSNTEKHHPIGLYLLREFAIFLAMSPLSVDLVKNSFFTFFSKKVKPKNFKYLDNSFI